jgi:hypothetical protein
MTPEKLINWGELSRLLAGSRSSITQKRIPKKHRAKIEALIEFIREWQK